MNTKLLENYIKIHDTKDARDNCTTMFLSLGDSGGTAFNKMRALFHINGDPTRTLLSLDYNDYEKIDNQTKEEKDKLYSIFLKELNEYIDILIGTGDDNYLLTFYMFLLYNGFVYVVLQLYIPKHLRTRIVKAIDYIIEQSTKIIDDTISYFTDKNDEELTFIVMSLKEQLVLQRTDQVIKNLQNTGYSVTKKDREFLSSQRSKYLDLSKGIKQEPIFKILNLSKTTYNNKKLEIIEDLQSKMTNDSLVYFNTCITTNSL